MYVLMVTWVLHGQPLDSYRVEFANEALCAAAIPKLQESVTELRASIFDVTEGTNKRLGVAENVTAAALFDRLPFVAAACVKSS